MKFELILFLVLIERLSAIPTDEISQTGEREDCGGGSM